jgi:hypothetical protein
MVESGEVTRIGGRYSALPLQSDHTPQKQGEGERQPGISHSGISAIPCSTAPLRLDVDDEKQNGKTTRASETSPARHGKRESDYADYRVGGDATDGDGAKDSLPVAAGGMQGQQHKVARHGNSYTSERSEDERQPDSAMVGIPTGNENQHCNQHQPRNHCNHSHDVDAVSGGAEEHEVEDSSSQAGRNRCPHHPRGRLVRFDPAGQAWCDRLDCWDCYRLMKLGEMLGFGSLTDLGGKPLIGEGRSAWSAFVLSQRPFLVMLATEAAIAQCKARGLDVPDLSGEVKQLVRLPPLSP